MNRITDKEQVQKLLERIRCFVLDMDGTIYLGGELFPYTPGFLEDVRRSGRDFIFFTNNSSKNAAAYVEKLRGMGISVSPDKMLISNAVMIQFLKERHPGQSAYVVGTPYLVQDFIDAGIPLEEQNPDLVVLGFDTTLVYEKLVRACDLVRAGKPVYGVNPDLNCPVEGGGFIPDCGSIARLVEASTGVLPEFLGKPSPHTLQYILQKTGLQARELAVVGDRLYTDIAVAAGSEATSILVLSGETRLEDLEESAVQPDLVFPSIQELGALL